MEILNIAQLLANTNHLDRTTSDRAHRQRSTAARIAIDPGRARIRLGGITVCRRGMSAGPAARRQAAARLERDEIRIELDLGQGVHSARIWTCDLSYDYVRINAEYTT